MQFELRMHRLVLAILAILLAAFLAILLYLYPSLASERLETIASLAIVVVAAAVFVAIGFVEGTIAFQFGKKHKREPLSYLLLGLVSIASGLYLMISRTASLQTIALIVAPHALFFGIGELRVAQHLQRHPATRRGLFISGLCEIALGIALVYGWTMSSEQVARLLGYTAILTILQLLSLLFYKQSRTSLHLGRAESRNAASQIQGLCMSNATIIRLWASPERILVATNLTDGPHLIPHAIAQARLSEAKVLLVHVIEPPYLQTNPAEGCRL